MNDPRIEAIVKERVELWRKWANLGQPKDRNNPIHAQQIGWSQCADELESLIPALSEIVRQAHAEAIESINDCIDRFIRLNGEWLISPKKMQERISSMTPTLARLEAELRIAEGALAEWCEHLVPTKCQEECLYCQRLDKLRHAIANLKVQIAAEKGK